MDNIDYTEEELKALHEVQLMIEKDKLAVIENSEFENGVIEFYNENKTRYDKIKPKRENFEDKTDYYDALEDWEQSIAEDYEQTRK